MKWNVGYTYQRFLLHLSAIVDLRSVNLGRDRWRESRYSGKPWMQPLPKAPFPTSEYHRQPQKTRAKVHFSNRRPYSRGRATPRARLLRAVENQGFNQIQNSFRRISLNGR